MDQDKNGKKVIDSVVENIGTLRNKIVHNDHIKFYSKELEKLESVYQERINDILERYIMAAAIGISYSIPIHEMKLRLTSIRHLIDDLEANPKNQDRFLRELKTSIIETEDIIRAVTSMMSRQRRQTVNLFKVAQNVEILKRSDLEKNGIQFEIKGDKSIEVNAVPGLLNTAVLNLVDNSIYWLRAKKNNSDEVLSPKIVVDINYNEEKKPVLIVKDNGEGFKDPFELLVEPYYSRKNDGLGLGLYLVNEIMTRFEGKLNGYNEHGAVVELTFK